MMYWGQAYLPLCPDPSSVIVVSSYILFMLGVCLPYVLPHVFLMSYPMLALCLTLCSPYVLPYVCLMSYPMFSLCLTLCLPYVLPYVCLMSYPMFALCLTLCSPYVLPYVCLMSYPMFVLCLTPSLPCLTPCLLVGFTESLLSLKKSRLLSMLDDDDDDTPAEKPSTSKIDDEYAAFQVAILLINTLPITLFKRLQQSVVELAVLLKYLKIVSTLGKFGC